VIWEDHFYPEVIDPETGAVLHDDERGEPPHRDVAAQRATGQRAATELQRQIKSYIGVSADVVICDPGTVERSIGKAKRVIDARSHQ
jgi:phenylacetate-coenzyme A ligase PaaK-like adenylate-forming protein